MTDPRRVALAGLRDPSASAPPAAARNVTAPQITVSSSSGGKTTYLCTTGTCVGRPHRRVLLPLHVVRTSTTGDMQVATGPTYTLPSDLAGDK
jgi:hypothetical protein